MPADCHLCNGPHDPEFHPIVEGLRKWFGDSVRLKSSVPLMPAQGPKRPADVPKAPRVKSEAANCIGYVPRHNFGTRQRVDLTAKEILKMQESGATFNQIAGEFGCSIGLVAKRLKTARAIEIKVRAALHKCPKCGKAKYPSRPVCNFCAKLDREAAKKPEATA
jgi:ribosomal protein L37AE/L43A